MRIPQLKRHPSGNYYIHWGGRRRYLGRDRREAERAYWDQLAAWRQWREGKQSAPSRRAVTLRELCDLYLADRAADCQPETLTFYRAYLARFIEVWGDIEADLFRPADLNLWKHDLIDLGLKPRTINHHMRTVRGVLAWAATLGHIPPVDFRGVRMLPLGPSTIDPYPIETVARAARRYGVGPWIAVNYLGVMRPSEVLRLINGHGHWVSPSVFRLDRGKTDRRASLKRHLVLSDECRRWMTLCVPRWTRIDAYSTAARRAGVSPKLVQKSAAMHLRQIHRAAIDDVETLLGHSRGRLSVTYHQPDWTRLLEVVSLLSLK